MERLKQFTLIISLLAFSWWGMQMVHELGHVLGGIISGAKLDEIFLHPLLISQTIFTFNPKPGFGWDLSLE